MRSLQGLTISYRSALCGFFDLCRVALMGGDVAAADRVIAQLMQAASRANSDFWKTMGRHLAMGCRRGVARSDIRGLGRWPVSGRWREFLFGARPPYQPRAIPAAQNDGRLINPGRWYDLRCRPCRAPQTLRHGSSRGDFGTRGSHEPLVTLARVGGKSMQIFDQPSCSRSDALPAFSGCDHSPSCSAYR